MALLGQNNHMFPLSRSQSYGSGYFDYNKMEQNTKTNNNNNNYYYYNSNSYMMMEKRQLFLRSYQLCRKKSLTEKLRTCLVRAKKVIWLRLKSARRFRKLACFRIRCGFYYRRRRFVHLLNTYHQNYKQYTNNNSHCFW